MRTNGTPRRTFETREEGERFIADPVNTDYHLDEIAFCPKCGKFHANRSELWLRMNNIHVERVQ